MALAYNLIAVKDLARGLDLRSAESNVADGYAEDLQNVVTNSAGHLAKRPGYQGFAGYLPFRVKEISHDGFQVTLKLDRGVDLSGSGSSPIVVYGKLPILAATSRPQTRRSTTLRSAWTYATLSRLRLLR